MIFRNLWPLGLFPLALSLLGCSDGREPGRQTVVRAVNAAVQHPPLSFQREHPANQEHYDLAYGGAMQALWEEDTYDFFIFARSSSGSTDEIFTFSKQIESGTTYTFVLLESAGALVMDSLEAPTVLGSATDAQVNALQAVEGLAPVDLYVVPTGTDILGATPLGTLSYRGQIAPHNLAAGEYELVVTPAGDPSTQLLHTTTFVLAAATATSFVVAPDTGEGLVPFSVVFEQSGNAVTFVDRNAPSAVRAINAANDKGTRDVAFDSVFSPPLLPAVPFATATAYAPVAVSADVVVNVTPPGNPGVLELTQHVTTVPAHSHTLVFTGDAGTLTGTFETDARRRIVDEAQLTVYDAALQFTAIEVVLVPSGSGTDPTTVSGPIAVFPGSSSATPLIPGSYDLYMRDVVTDTFVNGPLPITLAGSGIYSVLVTNGADATTADVAQFDDFLP